jgi:hypothetical protein
VASSTRAANARNKPAVQVFLLTAKRVRFFKFSYLTSPVAAHMQVAGRTKVDDEDGDGDAVDIDSDSGLLA